MPEPRTLDEHQQLWDLLPTLPSFVSKGPLCKLMRWFSFNDSAKYYHSYSESCQDMNGQLWALKMILEHHFSMTPQDEDNQPAARVQLPTNENEPREELRKLKAQTGQLKLAPQLITPENLWVLDLVIEVSKPSWNAYGRKAAEVKSPNDAIAEALNDQEGHWQTELVSLVASCMNGANNRDSFKKLGLLDCTSVQDADFKTSRLVDIVLLIIHNRSRSGATLTSLFPHRQSVLQTHKDIIGNS
jgi:hypothetical protein